MQLTKQTALDSSTESILSNGSPSQSLMRRTEAYVEEYICNWVSTPGLAYGIEDTFLIDFSTAYKILGHHGLLEEQFMLLSDNEFDNAVSSVAEELVQLIPIHYYDY